MGVSFAARGAKGRLEGCDVHDNAGMNVRVPSPPLLKMHLHVRGAAAAMK